MAIGHCEEFICFGRRGSVRVPAGQSLKITSQKDAQYYSVIPECFYRESH